MENSIYELGNSWIYQSNNWKSHFMFFSYYKSLRRTCLHFISFYFAPSVCLIPTCCISCTLDYKQNNQLWLDLSKKQIYWKNTKLLMSSKEKWRMGKNQIDQAAKAQTWASPQMKLGSTSTIFIRNKRKESRLVSVPICHLKTQENRAGNKNVKQSLVVSKVGCNHYDDKWFLFSDTHFYLALEIAVLKHGAVWTPKGVPIPKPKKRHEALLLNKLRPAFSGSMQNHLFAFFLRACE